MGRGSYLGEDPDHCNALQLKYIDLCGAAATICSTWSQYFALRLGVGDIIEKIIDSQYIGIFTTYQQIVVNEKNRFVIYRKIIVIENVNLILSDKNSSKNKSKRATALLLHRSSLRILT